VRRPVGLFALPLRGDSGGDGGHALRVAMEVRQDAMHETPRPTGARGWASVRFSVCSVRELYDPGGAGVSVPDGYAELGGYLREVSHLPR